MGAAIGAFAGQQIDAEIFKPKGREGPRLADLKVQASTYGQQIPQLFGTMRVAGSVIWATDLIERREKHGGGKGRPSATEYSYAVSLAIALSSRPVRAIRRIWADGNLLRGTSGTFQERCTFRWYDGSEDQAVDPLIAAAVGMGSASAFRGLSYAVFEELELASFGNRIPALTFEVEADAGAIDAGLVGDTLLGEAGRCAGRTLFSGYAASGDRVRDALAPLFDADGVRLIGAADGWRLAPTGLAGDPVALGAFAETRRIEAAADGAETRRLPLAALPGTVRLRHYEPGRDYQLGQQTAVVAGGGRREERIDLPAVLSAGGARALARRLAAAAGDGRETRVWRGDLAALALPVGGVVTLGDTSAWRVASRTVKDGEVRIELSRYQPVAVMDDAADPGVSVPAPDWPDSVGLVRLFDIPNLGAGAAIAPRVLLAAAGDNDGWRGAETWLVPTPGSEPIAVGTIRPAAALGALTATLEAGDPALFDGESRILVSLANPAMTLVSVDDGLLLGGANRAMVGDELIQFGVAEALAPGEWRLSRLLRGRAGTERLAPHPAGTPFVLLDDAALFLLPDALAGWAESGAAILQWTARGGSDLDDVAVPGGAAALRPLAPVHGRLRGDGAGGLLVDWIRRSRVDPGWRDGVDLPLGESREAWRVTAVPAATGLGPWDCALPSLHLSPAEAGAMAPGTSLEIRQVGDFALSLPLILALD
ncbi:phage tail protein [Sphingopyxis sp. PET50]|uniref:phage tail protein n=1 Tax=Sphingopyxis sp. PET50 TaxID=2976533 RepID=UPI0021AEDE59|nr:phage tail protein [Sphingopyxis sp. PET50]